MFVRKKSFLAFSQFVHEKLSQILESGGARYTQIQERISELESELSNARGEIKQLENLFFKHTAWHRTQPVGDMNTWEKHHGVTQ